MANEEEMENFEVSEQDLYEAYHPGQRRSYRTTKNQQIYGVFNYEEDNDQDDQGASSSYEGLVKNKKFKNSAPVGFVKGGVHQVGGIKEDSKEEKKKSKNESESDEDVSTNLSVEDEFILNSLNQKSKGKTHAPSSKDAQRSKPQGKRYFAGVQSHQPSGIGEWEKHTKGIGTKLLMQMGFEQGKGLGKSLQGRAVPVEAAVRKGRGAIGYGAEHKNQPEKFVDSEEDEQKEFRKGLAQWRKDGSDLNSMRSDSKKKETIRYSYRTTEDVIEKVEKSGVHRMAREISKVKVIEMTGKEQRVLSGYSALSAKKTTEPTDSEVNSLVTSARNKLQLDKLAYNLDALVDFCEHEIINNAKELSNYHDQITAKEIELKNLSSIVSKETKQIDSLSSILQFLEQIENRKSRNELELDYLLEQITQRERNHGEDYVSYDIANLMLTYLIPLLKSKLAGEWRPLETKDNSDENCRRLLLPWWPLLEFRIKNAKNCAMDHYDRLLWDGWMPALRGLIGQWRCKEAEPMVDLLDRWEPLLPEWIMESILDQLILPRIQAEVDAWNPLTDLIPIHAWIHPWLPRLSTRLEIVYPTIRQKMAHALVAWEPSDQSARSVLMPWVPVFSKGSMDAFLIKNILPKLHDALSKWTINPGQQELDVWKWVMQWKDLLPLPSLVTMLEKSFFPKWLQVLVTWLNHSPNYEEIIVWFKGWKSLFPQELSQHPAVQEKFTRALDMMNRSVAMGSNQMVPPVPLPPAPPTLMTPVMNPMVPAVPLLVDQHIPQGFRELVQYRCAEQDVLFIPMVNRWQAGRPIFRVGNVLAYFDRQIGFVLGPNGMWIQVLSPQQLIDMAIS